MYNKDKIIIIYLIETIDKIFLYTKDLNNAAEFGNDSESFDATLMNFFVLGEAVGRLSDDFKNSNNHIEWRKIYAFRNVIAHDYFGILPEEVWQIIDVYLPELYRQLNKLRDNMHLV